MEYSKLTIDEMFDILVQDNVNYLQELFNKNDIDEVHNYLSCTHIAYCYLDDDEIKNRYYESQHWEKEQEKNKIGE